MYSLVIWISTVLSLLVFCYSLQPQIGIGAVFESIDYNHYNGVFYRQVYSLHYVSKILSSAGYTDIPCSIELRSSVYPALKLWSNFINIF